MLLHYHFRAKNLAFAIGYDVPRIWEKGWTSQPAEQWWNLLGMEPQKAVLDIRRRWYRNTSAVAAGVSDCRGAWKKMFDRQDVPEAIRPWLIERRYVCEAGAHLLSRLNEPLRNF
jgi:hypothetical protein